MSRGKVLTVLIVRPPRLNDVIGVALSMGAEVLSVQRVVGFEKASFGAAPAVYDKICIETSRPALKETLDVVLEAARSGLRGDGKAFVMGDFEPVTEAQEGQT